LAWRFDESIARPMQNLNSIGLNDHDVVELTQAFHVCGFWRASLDDGFIFWTDHSFKIFEMEPHDGPVNITSMITAMHPDDSCMVLEALQRSIETQQTFHCIFRVLAKNGSAKWVRTIGKYHAKPDGPPEIRGMMHELFQHVPTAAFVVAP